VYCLFLDIDVYDSLHWNCYTPNSTKSRNSDFSVSRDTNSNRDFGLISICTKEIGFLDLVDFGGVAFSGETVIRRETFISHHFSTIMHQLSTGRRKCMDVLSCASLSAKEPLILELFCGKWPIKIRHPLTLHHPVRRRLRMHHLSLGDLCIVYSQTSTPNLCIVYSQTFVYCLSMYCLFVYCLFSDICVLSICVLPTCVLSICVLFILRHLCIVYQCIVYLCIVYSQTFEYCLFVYCLFVYSLFSDICVLSICILSIFRQ